MPMPDWLKIVQDYITGWEVCVPPPEKGKGRGWFAGVEYDWPQLTSDSIVVDVGGYEGKWASELTKLYAPQIYCFEPAIRAARASNHLLEELPNVQMFPYALGDRNGTFVLGDNQRDGASFLKNEEGAPAQMRDASILFDELGLTYIDLMQINVEGFEFILIPYLIRAGYIKKIRCLQIQWHCLWTPEGNGGPQNPHYRDIVRCKIAETHEMLWNAGTHEAWALSSPKDEQCKT